MKLEELKKYPEYFTEYTELRAHENRNTRINIVNGDIMANVTGSYSGVSARVFKNGYWGFASSPNIDDQNIKSVIGSATKNANFLSEREIPGIKELPSKPGESINDFSSKKPKKSQKELINFLLKIDEYILQNCPEISSRTIIMSNLDMEKTLVTSDGSASHSMIPRSLIIAIMTVKKDNQPVELSKVFGGLGQFEDVFENHEAIYPGIIETYEHLLKKADGVFAHPGLKDVILDADLAGILAHEAIGHTTEADLVQGGSVAGDLLNKPIASELITLVDFANTALGKTCPVPVYIDDEGTKAEDCTIIDKGILRNFMHNKHSAATLGFEICGNARAHTFPDEPLIRMRNTAILPGKSKLEDMIASIEDGYYLIKPSNGQADATSEFMFGITLGYEIKNGKLGKAIKDTTISGIAIDVLKSVTMVSDDMSWTGAGMCGKKQAIPVGMGGPAIKCKVNIGGKNE